MEGEREKGKGKRKSGREREEVKEEARKEDLGLYQWLGSTPSTLITGLFSSLLCGRRPLSTRPNETKTNTGRETDSEFRFRESYRQLN